MKKKDIKGALLNITKIIIGTVIMAIGIDFFLLPNQLSTGGFTGIATIIYYLCGFPVGTLVMLLNIPLFLMAYFRLGKEFLVNALLGTFFLSLFLNIFEQFDAITDDRFLAFLYGSIIVGIGTAIVLKADSSTGGSDLFASIAKTYKPQIKTGTFIVGLDTIIVLANTLFFKEIEVGLYSAIAIYVLGKVLDIFFEGIGFTKILFVISPKWSEIAERIDKEIDRGSTAIEAQGTYSNINTKMLMSAMSRHEIRKARSIVKEIDPSAFIIITNAREVFGEGFKKA